MTSNVSSCTLSGGRGELWIRSLCCPKFSLSIRFLVLLKNIFSMDERVNVLSGFGWIDRVHVFIN